MRIPSSRVTDEIRTRPDRFTACRANRYTTATISDVGWTCTTSSHTHAWAVLLTPRHHRWGRKAPNPHLRCIRMLATCFNTPLPRFDGLATHLLLHMIYSIVIVRVSGGAVRIRTPGFRPYRLSRPALEPVQPTTPRWTIISLLPQSPDYLRPPHTRSHSHRSHCAHGHPHPI